MGAFALPALSQTGWNEDSSTIGNIATLGIGTLNTVLGYKLQSQQIKAGQIPSISYDPNGRPSGIPSTLTGSISTGFPVWMMVAVAVLVLFAMFKK